MDDQLKFLINLTYIKGFIVGTYKGGKESETCARMIDEIADYHYQILTRHEEKDPIGFKGRHTSSGLEDAVPKT